MMTMPGFQGISMLAQATMERVSDTAQSSHNRLHDKDIECLTKPSRLASLNLELAWKQNHYGGFVSLTQKIPKA
jgi:hypothetical protein